MSDQEPKTQIGGVNISGTSGGTVHIGGSVESFVETGGDVVAGDKVTGAVQDSTQADLIAALREWKAEIADQIAALRELDEGEKQELADKADQVEAEATKGEKTNPGKLERLLNTMSAMAPDILEVTARTLQNPFAGVGLVLQKINDKIKISKQTQPGASAPGG